MNRFRSKADRDRFLNGEITSLRNFRTTQSQALDNARRELNAARTSADEIKQRVEQARKDAEEAREAGRKAAGEMAKAKDQQAEMVERRKGLWREETKLDSLVAHANEQMRGAESALAGMMDKASLLVLIKYA